MIPISTPDNRPPEQWLRTVIEVPGMDCSAEERLIRLALADETSISSLQCNLSSRSLVVVHVGPADEILARLVPLGFGARLAESTTVTELPTSPDSAINDAQERHTLWALLAINGLMFVGELAAGWLFQSAGLMADALDMLADAAVYGLSLYAVGRSRSLQLRSAHIAGWLQMALALGALSEVIRRFVRGSEPEPVWMVGVSLVALIANLSCLYLISRHREGGAHMQASWIFSTNDVLANLGVIVAGLAVALTQTRFPDLVVGAIIAAIVMHGGIRILRLR